MTIETAAYSLLYQDISDRIIGRIAIKEVEAVLLAETVAGSSLHVEVGCLYGGTAVLAALAGASVVYTVDSAMKGSAIKNFKKFGVADKIKVIRSSSHPWPVEDVFPDTFFIDGDHTYRGCAHDWIAAAKITKRAILMHDYCDDHPGVKLAVEAFAMNDPFWQLTKQVESMLLFERVNE